MTPRRLELPPPDDVAWGDQLDATAVAELAGVKPASIRQYRRRGSMPAPDGHIGRTPWWYRPTIEAWLEHRPIPGQHAP